MDFNSKYNDLDEAKKILRMIQIKIDEMSNRMHDLDPHKVDKFVKLLRKVWKFTFYRKN